MRVAQVIGKVTLNRAHPTFRGATLKLAVPMTLDELRTAAPPQAETLVVWDEWGAGPGSLIAVSEGPEAANPFRPAMKPVDAYNAAILDRLDLEP